VFDLFGAVVSGQVTPGGLVCSWLVGVGYSLRFSVCYLLAVRLDVRVCLCWVEGFFVVLLFWLC